MINTEVLDYVFDGLNDANNNAFEAEMMADEFLADEVDGILDFCIINNVTSKEEFEAKWEGLQPSRDKLFKKIWDHIEYLKKKDEHISRDFRRSTIAGLSANVEEFSPVEEATFGEELIRGIEEKLSSADLKEKELVMRYISGDNTVVFFLLEPHSRIIKETYRKFLHDTYTSDEIIQVLEKELSKTQTGERRRKFVFEHGEVNVIRSLKKLITDKVPDTGLMHIYCNETQTGNEAIALLIERHHCKLNHSVAHKLYDYQIIHIEADDIIADVTMLLLEKELHERHKEFFENNNIRLDFLKIICGRMKQKAIDYLRKKRSADKYEESIADNLEFLTTEIDIKQIDCEKYILQDLDFLEQHHQDILNKLNPLIKIAILRLLKCHKFNNDEYKICCMHFLGFNHEEIHKILGSTEELNRELSDITYEKIKLIKKEFPKIIKDMRNHHHELL